MIELLWNAPVSEAKMGQCIDALQLHSESRVLDVGCGCGEVLIRAFEHYRMRGLGIDSSPQWIAEARQRAARVADERIEFLETTVEAFQFDSSSLDLVMCQGASHAFGLGADAFRNALVQMTSMVGSGGRLLIADGYMKRPADKEYRQFLGDTIPDEMTHAVNVSTGQELGLVPLAAWTSSDDEWDHFEWTYQRIIEQQAQDNPDDADIAARLLRRREWMDAYLKWGRDTLGYGTYLFARP